MIRKKVKKKYIYLVKNHVQSLQKNTNYVGGTLIGTKTQPFSNQNKKPSVASLQLIFRPLPHPNKNFQKKDLKKEILYVVF